MPLIYLMITKLLLLATEQFDNHPFQRVTPGAVDIQHLFMWFMYAAAFVFIAVIGFMLYSMYKYRYRGEGDDREPPQTHSNFKVEASLTLFSFALVFSFAFLAVRFMIRMHKPPEGRSANEKADIVIIGHQWWWEAKYPKQGFTTANEVHFPVGKDMLVKFKSADVVHDWWLLALGEKIDMFPGHYNHLWINVKKAGKYWGTCSEYCGKQHANMQIHVVAQSPKAFKKWEKHQAQPVVPPANRMEALGSALFGSKACGSCHNIKGKPGANGDVGPDLTHVGSRKTLVTFLQNTPENMSAWLDNPQNVKKGAHMPSFHFNKEELKSLTTYLEGLK
jgi:cytochrome c oxidase subunit 2